MTGSRCRALAVAFLLLASVTWAAPLSANESDPKTADPKVIDTQIAKKRGLVVRSVGAATASINDNQGVIGQTDGSTVTIGYKLELSSELAHDQHENRASLQLAQSVTSTPALKELVKSQDTLRADTIYLFKLVDWFGPYLRAAMSTTALPGNVIAAEDNTYAITRSDGSVETVTTSRLRLTDMARPLTLKQGVGLFVRPVDLVPVAFELRAGGGAHEVFADEQLAVADDADTDEIEVEELATYHQLGVELAAGIWGSIADGRLSYKAGGEVLLPMWSEPSSEGNFSDSIDIEAFFTMSLHLVKWATVDYELRVARQPQLIETTQVSNYLLFNFGITRVMHRKLD